MSTNHFWFLLSAVPELITLPLRAEWMDGVVESGRFPSTKEKQDILEKIMITNPLYSYHSFSNWCYRKAQENFLEKIKPEGGIKRPPALALPASGSALPNSNTIDTCEFLVLFGAKAEVLILLC